MSVGAHTFVIESGLGSKNLATDAEVDPLVSLRGQGEANLRLHRPQKFGNPENLRNFHFSKTSRLEDKSMKARGRFDPIGTCKLQAFILFNSSATFDLSKNNHLSYNMKILICFKNIS